MRKAIVIGGNHYNTLGVIRSLGEKKVFIDYIQITGDKLGFVSRSKYIKNKKILLQEDLIEYLIQKYKNVNKKHIIYTTSDESTYLINKNRGKLAENFIIQGILNNDVKKAFDKKHVNNIAELIGIEVPKATIWCEKKPPKINDLSYPLILKPISGINSNKEDIIVVHKEERIKENLTKMSAKYNSFIIQEYIESKDSYMVEIIGLSLPSEKKIIVPGIIEKIREYPLDKGSTSYAYFNTKVNTKLNKLINELLLKLNYEGLFDIEFKYSEGKYYFIEINLRNGAPGYAITKAGINLPYLWFEKNATKDKNIFENLKTKNLYLMSETRDIRHIFKKDIKIIRWLSDLIKTKVFLEFNIKDIKPFLSRILGG